MSYFNVHLKKEIDVVIKITYKNGMFIFFNDKDGNRYEFESSEKCLSAIRDFIAENNISPANGYIDEALRTAMEIHKKFNGHDTELRRRRDESLKTIRNKLK